MKKAKILSGVLLLCFSSPLISQAATLDVVDIVAEAMPMRLDSKSVRDGKMDGGQAWKVIPGIPFMIIKKENAALNDVQVEVNYAIKLDDQWTVRPGMLTHFSSNGTRYGPYVKLSWDATKDLNFGIRYRYDWKAYRQQDLSGDMSRDNVHRWDGYVTYHINSDFTFAWQTTLYSKQNDYRYANHKKWATENAFVLQYHMTPDITPYIEYDYLDRQGVYNGRDNLSENSYRIGVSFKL